MSGDQKTLIAGSLLGFLAMLIAYFVGKSSAHPVTPVPAVPSPVEETEEKKAEEKIEVAQWKHDKDAETASIERDKVLAEQVARQEEAAPLLVDDLDALNRAMLDVGKDMRKP
jgi:hypothetical protein